MRKPVLTLEWSMPDWPIVRRFSEWVFPGTDWQVRQWGHVTRSRSWLGGLIELEQVCEESCEEIVSK